MVEEVKKKLPQLAKLCRKYKMSRLWLFGSGLDPEKFTSASDLDFLYSHDDGGKFIPGFDYIGYWSDMLDELRNLFKREVQLIEYGPFRNPYFRASVEATKQLIYDKDAEKLPV